MILNCESCAALFATYSRCAQKSYSYLWRTTFCGLGRGIYYGNPEKFPPLIFWNSSLFLRTFGGHKGLYKTGRQNKVFFPFFTTILYYSPLLSYFLPFLPLLSLSSILSWFNFFLSKASIKKWGGGVMARKYIYLVLGLKINQDIFNPCNPESFQQLVTITQIIDIFV